MKFAKELEQDLVPEWRAKYFDYKIGKKKVKAVARALRSVNQTPRTPGRQLPSNLLNNAFQSPIRNHAALHTSSAHTSPEHRVSALTSYGSAKDTLRGGPTSSQIGPYEEGSSEGSTEGQRGSAPLTIPGQGTSQRAIDESVSLWGSGAVTNYGSIIATPPSRSLPPMGPPSLELPDPALSPSEEAFPRHNRAWRQSRFNPNPHTTPPPVRNEGKPGDAYEAGKTTMPSKLDSSRLLPTNRNVFKPRRTMSTPGGIVNSPKPRLLRRLFSSAGLESPQLSDVPLEAYKEFDLRQAEYFTFLDKEVEKIDSFYRMKEAQAGERLLLLREQLHIMRDRRMQELRAEQMAREGARLEHERIASSGHAGIPNKLTLNHRSGQHNRAVSSALKWMEPIENAIGVGPSRIGRVTKSMQQWGSPSGPQAHDAQQPNRLDSRRDFSRRPTHPDDVPYRAAKRKLKLALQEFYRGLELLKSYALLNRTAFRKINKKYDKAIKARPTGRYMSEKVNKSWFVQSEVLEGQLVAVEDLYARYFERNNHKIAVGKLRSKSARAGDFSGSVFRNGLFLAAGLVFGIQGIVYGADHLSSLDPVVSTDTSYLLQIYAGYFLGLFLFLLFCLDCKVWTRAKINYPFIFEFDSRHNLDWHQLAELPCFLLSLLGICLWLNFQQSGTDAMFLYWPVILIGLTILILFMPAPILYHRSREWWAYSNFRLLLAGLYPVEFRDFFLGDMYCSQTYSMGNLELFFCLYAKGWNNPGQCNSTHSRLLGFFSTIPGIWRASQCLRRYYDTRNAFPHLVNCGKYTFTILFYMSLSLYRIDRRDSLKALFVTFATINSIYCSIWDLAMDWSLCNPYSEHPFLRDVLGYKRPWVYYLAMILDPILRFNWIFYAIFSGELQHSALLSFFVGFSEVCRRGIWTLFRVENEHCTNVGRFRASRDVPLPYDITTPTSSTPGEEEEEPQSHPSPEQHRRPAPFQASPSSAGTSSNLEAQPQTGSLRRRHTPTNTPIQRGIARVGTIMTQAHAQDFERKRRPDVPESASPYHGARTAAVESSDEEDEEEEEEGSEATGGNAAEDGGEAMRAEEEDVQNLQDAEEILRRHQSTTE